MLNSSSGTNLNHPSGTSLSAKRSLRSFKSVFGMGTSPSHSDAGHGGSTSGASMFLRDDWEVPLRQQQAPASHAAPATTFASASTLQTRPPMRNPNQLISLQLPQSMPTLDRMSPDLWQWIHSPDFARQATLPLPAFAPSSSSSSSTLSPAYSSEYVATPFAAAVGSATLVRSSPTVYYTRVFSPAGEPLEIPKHLLEGGRMSPAAPSASSSMASTPSSLTPSSSAQLDMLLSNSSASAAEPATSSSSSSTSLTRSQTITGSSRSALSPAAAKRRKPVPSMAGMSPSTSSASLAIPLPPLPQQETQQHEAQPAPGERTASKKFFIEIIDLHLKQVPQGDHVIAVVSVGNQKRCSSVMPLLRDPSGPKGFNITSRPLEGFLFDVPDNGQDFTITIRLYSKSPDSEAHGHGHGYGSGGNISHSPSVESFNSHASQSIRRFSIFGTKRSSAHLPTSASSSGMLSALAGGHNDYSRDALHTRDQQNEAFRFPASPTAIGSLLCEIAFSLPCNHAFSKVSGSYAASLGSKKELAKVGLQMGMFLDEGYSPEPVSVGGWSRT
ncbi:hypothetical protein BC831DRAFT_480954 [Entophlyctis helioformis]|nr:hypothetical protein BC831DRAFT_480954 [Entophlyctis helioformis]